MEAQPCHFLLNELPLAKNEPTSYHRVAVYEILCDFMDEGRSCLMEEVIFRNSDEGRSYRVLATQILQRLSLNAQHILKTHSIHKIPDISCEDLCKGTPQQLFHDFQRSQALHYANIISENVSKVDKLQPTSNSVLKCKNKTCRSINLTWEQKQTRSADEGMSIFVMCTVCKTRWKL